MQLLVAICIYSASHKPVAKRRVLEYTLNKVRPIQQLFQSLHKGPSRLMQVLSVLAYPLLLSSFLIHPLNPLSLENYLFSP